MNDNRGDMAKSMFYAPGVGNKLRFVNSTYNKQAGMIKNC